MYTKFITQVYDVALNTSMHQYCVIFIAPPTGHRNSDKHPISMSFIVFFPPYHINRKGTISSFLSGPNFTCLIRVQRWTHRPIYSHSHSATCWTQEMTFNPFLHCLKHRQLRDVFTIISLWGRVRGAPWQQHAPTRVDYKGLGMGQMGPGAWLNISPNTVKAGVKK